MIEEIVEKKRQQIEQEKLISGIDDISQKIAKMPHVKKESFASAISKPDEICIIGEVKKASPSKGVIKAEFDYMEIAKLYSEAKIDAVSVLTERYYFQGSDRHLNDIAMEYQYPVLRKDFIIDPFQIYQTKLLGASAILLIVSILSDEELLKFRVIAEILGLDCVIEVHNRDELERAVNSGAKIIGINNRDLKSFEVTLKTTEALIKYIPDNVVKVSESGIRTVEDLEYVKSLGVNAVLIGEMFMRSQSIVQEVCRLKGVVKV